MKKYNLMIMVEDGYYNPYITSCDLDKLNMIKEIFEEQGWEVEIEDCEAIEERRKNREPINYNIPEKDAIKFSGEITGDISDLKVLRGEL